MIDVCDPSVNMKDIHDFIKQNTGVNKKLTREQACQVYSDIKYKRLPLPPMSLTKDKTHLVDVRMPVTFNEMDDIFRKGTSLAELKRIARKIQAIYPEDAKKADVLRGIESRFKSLGILEPVKIKRSVKVTTRRVRNKVVAVNTAPVNSNVNAKANVNVRANANANANLRTNANANVRVKANANNVNVKVPNAPPPAPAPAPAPVPAPAPEPAPAPAPAPAPNVNVKKKNFVNKLNKLNLDMKQVIAAIKSYNRGETPKKVIEKAKFDNKVNNASKNVLKGLVNNSSLPKEKKFEFIKKLNTPGVNVENVRRNIKANVNFNEKNRPLMNANANTNDVKKIEAMMKVDSLNLDKNTKKKLTNKIENSANVNQINNVVNEAKNINKLNTELKKLNGLNKEKKEEFKNKLEEKNGTVTEILKEAKVENAKSNNEKKPGFFGTLFGKANNKPVNNKPVNNKGPKANNKPANKPVNNKANNKPANKPANNKPVNNKPVNNKPGTTNL
jgi:hypothetical protein